MLTPLPATSLSHLLLVLVAWNAAIYAKTEFPDPFGQGATWSPTRFGAQDVVESWGLQPEGCNAQACADGSTNENLQTTVPTEFRSSALVQTSWKTLQTHWNRDDTHDVRDLVWTYNMSLRKIHDIFSPMTFSVPRLDDTSATNIHGQQSAEATSRQHDLAATRPTGATRPWQLRPRDAKCNEPYGTCQCSNSKWSELECLANRVYQAKKIYNILLS